MISAICKLKSLSPYSQSRFHDTPFLEGESHDDHEQRTWRERLHTENGHVVIPPMAFKQALDNAATFLRLKKKGTTPWTKTIHSGVMIVEGVVLAAKAADVPGERLLMSSTGQRGGGKRVPRIYPRIDSWTGEVTFEILNPEITEDVFRKHLEAAGKYVGIGRFRPENRGYYGRFEVDEIDWIDTRRE